MTTQFGFATTVDTGVAFSANTSSFIIPMLQAQDGSFYGTDDNGNMMRMTGSGQTMWSVPNDYPQIATADGGVIGYSSTTYDNQGRANGQIASMPTQSWLGNGYQIDPGQAQQVTSTPPSYAASYAAASGGNPSTAASGALGGPYIESLGSVYRGRVANIAKGYVGDSTDWAKGSGGTTCNKFVRDVLIQTSKDIDPDIPYPVRPNLSWYQTNFRHPFLAADWANPNMDGGCWKPLPAGPEGALPGDIIVTGWYGYDSNGKPLPGNDGTGHVGIVVAPNTGAPNYIDASAADVPPYWWTAAQKGDFVPGTITLTDYGFRLPGFDFTDPKDVQGLKQDSHVRRFMCY